MEYARQRSVAVAFPRGVESNDEQRARARARARRERSGCPARRAGRRAQRAREDNNGGWHERCQLTVAVNAMPSDGLSRSGDPQSPPSPSAHTSSSNGKQAETGRRRPTRGAPPSAYPAPFGHRSVRQSPALQIPTSAHAALPVGLFSLHDRHHRARVASRFAQAFEVRARRCSFFSLTKAVVDTCSSHCSRLASRSCSALFRFSLAYLDNTQKNASCRPCSSENRYFTRRVSSLLFVLDTPCPRPPPWYLS